MTSDGGVHISVVSHGQCGLVAQLLEDLERHCQATQFYVTVTLNIPEPLCFKSADYSFPIDILWNSKPKGFAANQNAAFQHGLDHRPCRYFCVVNPDVRLESNVVSVLMDVLRQSNEIGIAAPLVRDSAGRVEDSARPLPRFYTPFLRFLGFREQPSDIVAPRVQDVDWVAGMFMVFPTSAYQRLEGFDERYFLYYEDVDICTRARLAGYRVVVDSRVSVIHDARRDSHRRPMYLMWHMKSALRFFSSQAYRDIRQRVER